MNQALLSEKRDTPEVHNHAQLQRVKSTAEIDRTQTCFAGQGTLTKAELTKDLEYAASVRRHHFW